MTREILEKFFRRYEAFFMKSLYEKVDGEEMAKLYAPEFIAASPYGVMTGRNNGDFRQALSAGYEQYRKIGTKGMYVREVKMIPIDEMHCIADVAWTASYEKENGRTIDIDFDVHYLMQEKDSELCIFGWITGDEQALLKEYGVM